LATDYIAEFNRKFTVPAAQAGTASVPLHRLDLDRVFSIQHERVVANDNTIQFANHVWQIPSTPFRATLAGCRVMMYEYLDQTFSVGYSPHTVAGFNAAGELVPSPKKRAVETAASVENGKQRRFPHDARESRGASQAWRKANLKNLPTQRSRNVTATVGEFGNRSNEPGTTCV
jgi:hypothetical protein